MRILHVIDKSFVGGGQMFVRDLAEGLGLLGLHVEVACRSGGPLIESLERLSVRVHSIPFDKRFRLGPARDIVRIVVDGGFNIVHAHGLVATTYAALARRWLGLRAPVIYQQHGFHHHNYGWATRSFRMAAERWVAKATSLTIAASLSDRQALEQGGYAPASRLIVLPPGVPEATPSFSEQNAVARSIPDDGRPCVGLIARLHPQKAVDVLLRAAVLVSAAAPDVRFVIVGDGPLKSRLHQLSASLGLTRTVLFTGTLPGRACIPRFDVAVLCSNWEGMPLTLLDYMAGGRAIACTSLPACREILEPDAAVLVPVGQPSALADAILGLLRDRERASRFAARARFRYEERHTLLVVARQYRRLYECLIASAAPAIDSAS